MVKQKKDILSDALKEVKVGEQCIGYTSEILKIAVLDPESLIKEEFLSGYHEKIRELEKNEYRIAYRPAERQKKMSRKRVYEIFEKS